MFADPAVRAIVASIGGYHSCQLLPLLDWDLIRANPKIFMGYSDVAVLNMAIWHMTGLVTFNGPGLITEWAEYPRMLEYTERYALKALCEAEPIGVVEPAPWWTEDFLDLKQKADLTRPRNRILHEGRTWIRKGQAEGTLIGGALEALQHLRGTPYWPKWDGAIFCAELVGGVTAPATADGLLMDYENMGVFDRINGLAVGRPSGYTVEQRQQLREIVAERTRKYDFPVVTDLDFGHTSPLFTFPIGCQAVLNADDERFEIVEAAVS